MTNKKPVFKSVSEPVFKSVPNFRNYEDYHDAEQYVRGWNDAMRFIFGIEDVDDRCHHIWKDIIAKSEKEKNNDKVN